MFQSLLQGHAVSCLSLPLDHELARLNDESKLTKLNTTVGEIWISDKVLMRKTGGCEPCLNHRTLGESIIETGNGYRSVC